VPYALVSSEGFRECTALGFFSRFHGVCGVFSVPASLAAAQHGRPDAGGCHRVKHALRCSAPERIQRATERADVTMLVLMLVLVLYRHRVSVGCRRAPGLACRVGCPGARLARTAAVERGRSKAVALASARVNDCGAEGGAQRVCSSTGTPAQ
jgi:hypothetical protein